jgi:SAM-dependent methyltransferase
MRARLVASIAIVLGWIAYVGLAAEQLASRSTEEWIKTLDAPKRIAGLKVGEVVERLKISPGDVVADLGAGTGAFVPALSKAVGPTGKVYAVEIDQGLVDHIAGKVKAAGITNVQVLFGQPTEPALPGSIDLAFMNDVLHHVQDRPGFIKQVARYLKPGARFAVIDPAPASSPHRGEPPLIVARSDANLWFAAAGLAPREEIPLFADRWFVIYGRR